MGWWERIQWKVWKVLRFFIPKSLRKNIGWFWIHLTHVEYVVGVFVVIFRNGEILLVNKEGVNPGWKIPGGGKEKNFTLEAQARRELYQETGIRVGQLKLIMNHIDETHRDFHVVFLGTEIHGQVEVHDKDEIHVAKFVPLAEARQLLNGEQLDFLNCALTASAPVSLKEKVLV